MEQRFKAIFERPCLWLLKFNSQSISLLVLCNRRTNNKATDLAKCVLRILILLKILVIYSKEDKPRLLELY